MWYSSSCLTSVAAVETGSRPAAKQRDVGDALLLVDDQVLDDVQVLGLGLRAQVRRVVAVVRRRSSCGRAGRRSTSRARAGPSRRSRREARASPSRPPRPSTVAAHRRVLEPARREHRVPPGRQRQRRPSPRAWKYVISNGRTVAVEAVVGVAPGVVGRPAAAVGAGHREPRRRRGARRRRSTDERAACPAGGGSAGSPRPTGLDRAARDRRRPAATTLPPSFADERDAPAVGRPARRGVVALAVRQLERDRRRRRSSARAGCTGGRGRSCRPRAARRAPSRGAPSSSSPRCGRAASARPARASMRQRSAGAPDVAAVGDEDQLLAVGRPGRREVLVELRVVVARQPAVLVLGDRGRARRRRAVRDRRATKTCQRPWNAVETYAIARAVRATSARRGSRRRSRRARALPPLARSSSQSSSASLR